MSVDVIPGQSSVQFRIQEAFEDGDDLIIELKAFVAGPRGGRGQQMDLPKDWWNGILPKLAARGVHSKANGVFKG